MCRRQLDRLRGAAFGAEGLFADGVTVERDGAGGVPVAPAEVAVAGLGVVPVGGFATSEVLPLRGMRRVGNTCYVLTTAQVLLRTPGMREWLIKHGEDGCPREQTSCVLCSLFMTLCSYPCVEYDGLLNLGGSLSSTVPEPARHEDAPATTY